MTKRRRVRAPALCAEFAREGVATPEFEDLLRERGDGSFGTAICLWDLPDEDFDVSCVPEDALSEERYDALCDGARPTERELALWRKGVRDSFYEDASGPGGNIVWLWRLTDDDGVPMWAVTAQEDGGSWAEVFGPYVSASAALDDLRDRADVTEVSWPDDPEAAL